MILKLVVEVSNHQAYFIMKFYAITPIYELNFFSYLKSLLIRIKITYRIFFYLTKSKVTFSNYFLYLKNLIYQLYENMHLMAF